jgi:hypothetical protein
LAKEILFLEFEAEFFTELDSGRSKSRFSTNMQFSTIVENIQRSLFMPPLERFAP